MPREGSWQHTIEMHGLKQPLEQLALRNGWKKSRPPESERMSWQEQIEKNGLAEQLAALRYRTTDDVAKALARSLYRAEERIREEQQKQAEEKEVPDAEALTDQVADILDVMKQLMKADAPSPTPWSQRAKGILENISPAAGPDPREVMQLIHTLGESAWKELLAKLKND